MPVLVNILCVWLSISSVVNKRLSMVYLYNTKNSSKLQYMIHIYTRIDGHNDDNAFSFHHSLLLQVFRRLSYDDLSSTFAFMIFFLFILFLLLFLLNTCLLIVFILYVACWTINKRNKEIKPALLYCNIAKIRIDFYV